MQVVAGRLAAPESTARVMSPHRTSTSRWWRSASASRAS